MGLTRAIHFEEADAHIKGPGPHAGRRGQFIVLLIAALIFLGCIVSPPALMDDMDATQAQIARTMLDSGDWVTARINGVIYVEKPPLKYWLIALSFRVFGVTDWAARIPTALAAVLLCWVTALFGTWAFDARAGTYAGTLENAETTSIVILALNSTSTFRLFPILPPWIVYVFIGFAAAAGAAVVLVLMLERRKRKLTQQ